MSAKKSLPILLIRNTDPENYGGAETYQLDLARELKKNGERPIIVSSSKKLLQSTKSAGIEAIKAPYLKNQNWSSWRNLLLPIYSFHQFRLQKWYQRLFLQLHPIAVNIQSRDDWIAATKAAMGKGIKIFWTDHMDFRTWVFTNIQKPFKNIIGKYILHLAPKVDRIIFISNYERQSFEQAIVPKKLTNLITILNGSTAAPSRQKSLPSKSCSYVGRIVDYKGINELLEAWQSVYQQHPDATLNVYGSGDQAIIQKILTSPGVHYHGFTDKPKQAIADSGIFVLPSYREGLSLALLDAAMLGRAIIATDIDGNPEVVQDERTGLLVTPHSSQSLAEALTKLLIDPEMANRLGKNAANYAAEKFNFSKTIKSQFLPLIHPENSGSPFFSIIIPAYNSDVYLDECLKSVQEQSYLSWEAIIVDDGSTDQTAQIAKTFQKQDSRFRVFHTKNQGLSAARNFGVDHASGKYVLFLDSDDLFAASSLQAIAHSLEKQNFPELLRFQAKTISENSGSPIQSFSEPSFSARTGVRAFPLLAKMHFTENAWLYCYQTEFFHRHSFRYAKGKLSEDFGLTPLIIAKAQSVSAISGVCYAYRQRSGSIMHDEAKQKKRIKDILDQTSGLIKNLQPSPKSAPIAHFVVVSALTSAAKLSQPDFLELYQKAKNLGLLKYIHPSSPRSIPRSWLLKHAPERFYKVFHSR